ncbi:porin family protein [Mycetocola spongiae]|uniref:hypothetical protein n=1 Tax=Mycetocola spongiae TaxID=2859226 RepID=UPI001CF4EEF5|nr:hypothetical protein [Mycetocola spongiae]UCR89263.1 hypothetical protein KXZ72_00675 [Mycetocola spongiae]
MDSRIKVKRFDGRPIRVIVRDDDLAAIGEANFYRCLAEVDLEPHMIVEGPTRSKSRPYVWTTFFDEGRTHNGTPGTEVSL